LPCQNSLWMAAALQKMNAFASGKSRNLQQNKGHLQKTHGGEHASPAALQRRRAALSDGPSIVKPQPGFSDWLPPPVGALSGQVEPGWPPGKPANLKS
jgi:hypothetical protein